MAFKDGDYKVECQRCGFEFYRSECQFEQKTGLLVCSKRCFDPEHPQDKPISGKGEPQSVPDHYPPQEPLFIDTSTNGIDEL